MTSETEPTGGSLLGENPGSLLSSNQHTIVTKPPVDADTLRKNPLGIYIDAIDWSRELDGETLAQSAAQPASTAPPNLPIGSPLDSRRSEEHTSELQSLMRISYAVFCLKKKTLTITPINNNHNTHN